MSWWNDFADRIECDAPLGRKTWFRLGGRARYLFQPHSAEQLAALAVRAREQEVPLKVLGRGANVLVSDDGFDGVVVRLDHSSFRRVERRGSQVDVGAGVELMPFARACSARGLSGLECMAGIPATIGGAIRMNAGGRSGEFGNVVKKVRVLGPEGGTETWSRQRCGFGYRHSELGDNIVLSAQLELVEDDPGRVRHAFEECFAQKRDSQPLGDRSAGCIFKNPVGRSAGALIDQAGLKGKQWGAARVSERHANFIVARRGATASDVLHLIDLIRERVRSAFSTELEVEVDIWRPVGVRR